MNSVMMALGGYRFSLATAAYEKMRRETEYGWQEQRRLGRAPAMQKMTGTRDTLSLNGIILPHFKGGIGQVEAMRSEAGKDAPLELVDGAGWIHGLWVILKIGETRSEFFSDGAPKLIEFSLDLQAYGEDQA